MINFEALDRYVMARLRTPFAWGREENDCVSYALGALEACGRDLAALEGIGNWSTKRGAVRALRRFAGQSDGMMWSAFQRVADLLRGREVPRGFQRRGDIVFYPSGDDLGGAIGVIYPGPQGELSAPGETGLIFQRLPEGARIFRFD
jgi:hypothetical protein